MVTKIGYSPLFVVLAIFDIVAAFIVWTVARELKPQAVSGPEAAQTLQPAS
jgi:ACS family hexuronate transporter-like MFS transporter